MEVETNTNTTVSSTNEQTPRKKHNFKIKAYTSFAYSSFSISLETCGICRNSVNEPSVSHTSGETKDDTGLSIAIGECSHGYHLDCIQRWNKQRPVCPLCNHKWEIASIEKIQGFGMYNTA